MSRTCPISKLSVAAMLTFALACGGPPEDVAAPGSDPSSAGETRTAAGPPVGTWNLTGIDGAPIADDVDVTLTIEAGGRISGGSGCNRYTAAATFDGSSMSVGPVAGTRMACAEPLMDLETSYLGALDGVESYEVVDDVLRLVDGDGNTRLEFDRTDDGDAAA